MDLECLPYGAGHEDEGVCVWLRMGPHRILLDCGLRDISDLLGETSHVHVADIVLCSNARADRARGLLYLHRAAPHLPIYASEVTAQLLPLNWLEEKEVPPFCQGLPWRSPVELQEDLWVELFPAGHLPGGSLLRLTYTGGEYPCAVVYTGDFLLSNSRLVDGLPLEELRSLAPDILIVEGSYGTARYPRRRTQENQLAERIDRAIAQKESVLLPVSPLGLGQELLMLLRSHHNFTGRDLDIWVDETIAAGCDAYLELLPHFPTAVQNFARHQPIFWDDRIRPRMRRLTPEARSFLGSRPEIVLIATETDLSPYCQNGSWLILLQQQPGYPSALENLDLPNSTTTTLETYLLSEHCDVAGTTQLIHNLRPQHVVLVRGSPVYLADLTNLEELRNRYQLHCPGNRTLVELPLREKITPSELAQAQYEGEISEHEWGVAAILPSSMTQDSRWQKFADTGVIETRWQGDELVLRGVSGRELLERGRERPIPLDAPFCANCAYYRAGHCSNQASPLRGFKVAPDGTCPVFESDG
ncbi:MAG: MBL fold metallo-hydrolase [Geitlerinemataceae cyanobacterium]